MEIPGHFSAEIYIGRSGTWLGACVNSQKKTIWAEFCCNGPPGKLWFDELAAQKEAIEREFGQPLSWQRLDDKKQSRIAIYREGADPTNETDWPAQHEWLVTQLERMRNVFQQRVLSLSGNGALPASMANSAQPYEP